MSLRFSVLAGSLAVSAVGLLAGACSGGGGTPGEPVPSPAPTSTPDGATPTPDASMPPGSDGGPANPWATAVVTPCWGYELGDLGDYVSGIAVHPSGDVMITGEFEGTANLGGTVLTADPARADGGVAAGLATFIARLRASDGTPVWARFIGQSGQTRVRGRRSITLEPDGSVVVAGYLDEPVAGLGISPAPRPSGSPEGDGSSFLARFDAATGATLKARSFPTNMAYHVARASDGSYFIGGNTYVARVSLDDATELRWEAPVPTVTNSIGTNYLVSLAVVPGDDVLVLGDWWNGSAREARFARRRGTDGAEVWGHAYSHPSKSRVRFEALVMHGAEAFVLGSAIAPVTIGGHALPMSAGRGWFGAWSLVDGAVTRAFELDGSRSARLPGFTGDGLFYYSDDPRLVVVDPRTGAKLASLNVRGNVQDPARGRWYGGPQGEIACDEVRID